MYELIFWQYCDEVYLNNHEVYEQLIEDKVVDGLKNLPIEVILNRLAKVFSTWEKVDGDSWKNASTNEAFQIRTTIQSVKIDCYGTNGKTMDLMVATLDEFQCPLYEPQIPARYDEFFE